MPPPSQPQPVTRQSGRSPLSSSQAQPVAGPSSHRLGASPMTGISFTNGGGFSFEKYGGGSGGLGRSVKMSGGGNGGAGSYGARFYGGGFDSPTHPFSTSITMEPSSFSTSSAAFNLPPPLSTSSSFRGGRSYAAAAKGGRDFSGGNRGHAPHNPHARDSGGGSGALSTSFAGMSFQPMSMSFSFGGGNGSYSKNQVHSLMQNRARTDAELTQTYECCGHTHHGLHDLLEHVEDAHPLTDDTGMGVPGGTGMDGVSGDIGSGLGDGAVSNPGSAVIGTGTGTGISSNNNVPPIQHIGFSPQVMAMEMDMDVVAEPPNLGTIEERVSGAGSTRSSMSPSAVPAVPSYPVPTTTTSASAASSKPSTPNEGAPSPAPAPLQISDLFTSPFGNSPLLSNGLPPMKNPSASAASTSTSTSNSSSSPPDGSLATPTTSQHPSPVFTVPKVAPTRGFLGSAQRLPQQRFDRAFNEVVAGSPKDKDGLSLNGRSGGGGVGGKGSNMGQPTAVAPGILFASAVAGLGIPTTPPIPGQKPGTGATGVGVGMTADGQKVGEGSDGAAAAAAQTTPGLPGINEPQLPQPSLFTTHKPWRCPNPGCNKAYKQSNGLKYHQQKGQCDYAIHDAVDLGLSIEEAEERSRPFVCAVGAGCTKRYRQMNGLKYHYLNSGEHGQYGLRMLQNGTHPMPTGVPGTGTGGSSSTHSSPNPGNSTSAFTSSSSSPLKRPLGTTTTTTSTSGASTIPTTNTARPNAAPYHIPSQIGATRPRMGVFPTTPANPLRTGTGTVTGIGGVNGGLGGVGRAGVPVRPSMSTSALNPALMGINSQQSKAPPVQRLPPIQRGRDAVLFAAVDTMDL